MEVWGSTKAKEKNKKKKTMTMMMMMRRNVSKRSGRSCKGRMRHIKVYERFLLLRLLV
jgi:hypothetical protein